MPYVLSDPKFSEHYQSIGARIAFDKVKEIIYNNFDDIELYIVVPEDPSESLNSENELLLTVCDILERIEQKLFD